MYNFELRNMRISPNQPTVQTTHAFSVGCGMHNVWRMSYESQTQKMQVINALLFEGKKYQIPIIQFIIFWTFHPIFFPRFFFFCRFVVVFHP